MTYGDFATFGVAVKSEYSLRSGQDSIRLNGQESGGDQNAWGYFWHEGRKWKVDADTFFEPLIAAHDYLLETGLCPFVEGCTEKRYSLNLVDEIRNRLIAKDERYIKNKYCYIYSPRVTSTSIS